MDTSRLDLNLLVTLDTLLAERNVTHAARRLNLSQPALSARLARLRDLFGDPLLIPAQRGMVLTQRAMELQSELHEALEGVRRVVAAGSPFDAAQADATISIAASDYVQSAVLAPLLHVLSAEAPKLRIAWRALDLPSIPVQLERGEVDLAFMRPEIAPGALRMKMLYREDYVLIARRNHPQVGKTLDLDLFCELEHVVVSPEGGGFKGPTDIALEAMGRARRVVVSAPGFLVVLGLVARSDMIALVPSRIVSEQEDGLQVFAPPFGVQGFDMAMVWHDRVTMHPLQRWLRDKVENFAVRPTHNASTYAALLS